MTPRDDPRLIYKIKFLIRKLRQYDRCPFIFKISWPAYSSHSLPFKLFESIGEEGRSSISLLLSFFFSGGRSEWGRGAAAVEAMEKAESQKPTLNLPDGMTQTSLHLDSFSTRRSFTAVPKLTSPSKTTYSDRFIPCRTSSRLQNFALVDKASPAKEGGNDAYARLLRSELLGDDPLPGSPAAAAASPMSPNKNMFRFKTDHSAPSSPFAQSISGHDIGVVSEASTTPKAARKVPKTPHKVGTHCLCSIANGRKIKGVIII